MPGTRPYLVVSIVPKTIRNGVTYEDEREEDVILVGPKSVHNIKGAHMEYFNAIVRMGAEK